MAAAPAAMTHPPRSPATAQLQRPVTDASEDRAFRRFPPSRALPGLRAQRRDAVDQPRALGLQPRAPTRYRQWLRAQYTIDVVGQRIHVCSSKYDGSPHWEFDSWSAMQEEPLLITVNFAGQELQTWKGPWVTPYHTRNHFWSDRWYNVMRLERPRGGGLEGWYCNVTTPSQFDGENVCYADLDLDVRVSALGETEVMDDDEFVQNSARMQYPPEVVSQARQAVDELLALVRDRRFPFDDLPAKQSKMRQ